MVLQESLAVNAGGEFEVNAACPMVTFNGTLNHTYFSVQQIWIHNNSKVGRTFCLDEEPIHCAPCDELITGGIGLHTHGSKRDVARRLSMTSSANVVCMTSIKRPV